MNVIPVPEELYSIYVYIHRVYLDVKVQVVFQYVIILAENVAPESLHLILCVIVYRYFLIISVWFHKDELARLHCHL